MLIFVLIYLFRDLFTKYLFRLIIKLFSKTPTPLFTNLLLSYEKPLRFFFSVLGIYVALIYLPLSPGLMETVTTIYRCLVIITIGWGLYNYFSTKSYLFTNMAKKIDVGEDSMMVPFLSKLFRFIIIALTLTVVAFELDYDINALLPVLVLEGLPLLLLLRIPLETFLAVSLLLPSVHLKRVIGFKHQPSKVLSRIYRFEVPRYEPLKILLLLFRTPLLPMNPLPTGTRWRFGVLISQLE